MTRLKALYSEWNKMQLRSLYLLVFYGTGMFCHVSIHDADFKQTQHRIYFAASSQILD